MKPKDWTVVYCDWVVTSDTKAVLDWNDCGLHSEAKRFVRVARGGEALDLLVLADGSVIAVEELIGISWPYHP